MKMENENGFTLIELILVIVILGILAAVAIPKFSGLQYQAYRSTEDAVISQVKAGLDNYAAEQLVTTGLWNYPAPNISGGVLSAVLDEVPDDWSYASVSADSGTFTIARADSTIKWGYKRTVSTSATRGSHTISGRTSAD